MKTETLQELIDTLICGNHEDFKTGLKRMSKLDLITLIQLHNTYYENEYPRQHFIEVIKRYLED